MAQLMPLPLTVSCSRKFRLVYLSGTGSPGKSQTNPEKFRAFSNLVSAQFLHLSAVPYCLELGLTSGSTFRLDLTRDVKNLINLDDDDGCGTDNQQHTHIRQNLRFSDHYQSAKVSSWVVAIRASVNSLADTRYDDGNASSSGRSYSNTTVYYGIHKHSECILVDSGITNLIHDRRSCVDFTLEVRRMWLDVSTQA